ncbi:MAG: hypothetical protein NTY04_00115 [Candidatus Staskawiczbacteria bacterium]|nr:hypothetical protein [Candidatus Staskawiczbacteria bacterium]
MNKSLNYKYYMKKIIIFLILVSIISVPFFVSAQTAPAQDQLTQQLIQLLQQTIVQLQQQIVAILAQKNTTVTTNTSTSSSSASSASSSFASVSVNGTLDLSQSASYSSQTVIAPQTNFKLAQFSLRNNTTKAVNLNKIQADLSQGPNLYLASLYVANFYVTYGENKTEVLRTVAHSNYFQINYNLSAGKTIEISLYADINSGVPINATINSGLLVTGATNSGAVVSSNSGDVLAGPNIVFAAGTLAVSQDGSTPAAKIFASNQKIIAGKFQITSTADSYIVSDLKFVIPGSINYSAITDVILVDTVTQITIATTSVRSDYASNNSVFDFNVNIPVLANLSKSLTVYYDLGAFNSAGGTVSINIAPVLAYIKATNSSGKLIDGSAKNYTNIPVASYGGITLPDAGVTVNGAYVFKTIPTFTASQPEASAYNNSNINLYRFNMAADPSGDVSVKQIIFKVTINDPNNSNFHLTNFTFFKGGSDYTASVNIGNVIGDNYIGLIRDGGIGSGLINKVVVTFNKEEVIPAGKNQTYTLKAYANSFVNTIKLGADSVSTYIPADTSALINSSYLRPINYSLYYGLTQGSLNDPIEYNLLWSDRSQIFSIAHNDSINSSSGDWYNGFDIPGLPLESQTVVAK